MKNKNAIALGRMGGKSKSPKKQEAARKNGKLGGRKPLNTHCDFPGCSVNIGHDHI